MWMVEDIFSGLIKYSCILQLGKLKSLPILTGKSQKSHLYYLIAGAAELFTNITGAGVCLGTVNTGAILTDLLTATGTVGAGGKITTGEVVAGGERPTGAVGAGGVVTCGGTLAPSGLGHGDVGAEEKLKEEKGRKGSVQEGGARMTKAKIEVDFGVSTISGKVEAAFTTTGPDSHELGQ